MTSTESGEFDFGAGVDLGGVIGVAAAEARDALASFGCFGSSMAAMDSVFKGGAEGCAV